MKPAVAYYRVSSKRQGKSGLGLEAQKKSVHDFVARNKLKLITEFKEVESGRRNHKRILAKVLEVCSQHEAILLIARVDRLSRNLVFIATLMESSIPFVSVDKPYADEYELHMEAANAQRESRVISKRTKDALQAAKRRGVKLGTSIKRLLRKKRHDYKLFAKKMKPVIRRFQKNGIVSVRQLAVILNAKHIKTFRGGSARWHLSTVHRLLKTF